MEGGRGSSFNVELEQADDKESLEALHEGREEHQKRKIEVSEVSPSQRNVHRVRQRFPHEAETTRRARAKLYVLKSRPPKPSFFESLSSITDT